MEDRESIEDDLYAREESQIASSPRHEMEVHVRLGASREGKSVRLMCIHCQIQGHMEITVRQQSDYRDTNPFLYINSAEAHRFAYDVVYTNHMAAGAYRGYGATQESLRWNLR